MIKLHHIFFCLLLLNVSFLKADDQVDSLLHVLQEQSDPQERAKTLYALGDQYYLYSNDTAIYYYKRSLLEAEQTDNAKFKSKINYALALCHQHDEPATCTEYTMNALKYAEEANDARHIAYSRMMLGNLYRNNDELDKALDEYTFALKTAQSANDSLEMSRAFNNIGIVHMMKANYDVGLEYWQRSLDIKLRMGNEEAAAPTMANIGLYYKDIGRYYEAKDYLDRAMEINMRNRDYEALVFNYTVLGDMYWRMRIPDKAVPKYKLALHYADTLNLKYAKMEPYIGLSKVLDSMGRYEEALSFHRDYLDLVLAYYDEENAKITRELTTKFETEKKEQENALLKNENAAKDAQIALEEANIRYLWIGLGLAFLILVLIIFILNRVRSAKKEIEYQKHIVEEKNREITDSITYAKRLQTAILPTDAALSELLRDSFVLYLPKDIVAGDFYWAEKSENKVLFAVADCTGHGVPGAMVSVVCHNALNRAVREFGLTDPGKILDKVTDLVIETFEKSTEEVKDGMDISLCCIDFENKQLKFSGANNGLYHLTNGELNDIKPTKQPVGKYADRKAFQTEVINFNTGDVFYLFTDGFADQFGGDKGKKMKYKPFKRLLINNHKHSMRAQHEMLKGNFEKWMGSYEQVDDVCVAGIRV